MAAGCAVVGSRTAPVQEVIEDGRNGWLVVLLRHRGLGGAAGPDVVSRRLDAAAVRQAARATVVERYDLHRRCLPQGLALLDRLACRTPQAVSASSE